MMYSKNKGLGLLETLFAIGIITLLLAFGFGPFDAIKERQMLNKAVEEIESLLQEAKTNTIASTGGVRYGVHFETSSVTLFSGSVYSPSASDNKTLIINNSVYISNISLSGGGSEIVFNRITGDTDNNGTIRVSVTENPSRSRLITVFPVGTFFTE